MPEGKRTFKVGERIADIPAEKIDGFMQTHPDAIEVKSFIVDKDTADIPLDKVDGFLKAYPNAKPLYSDNTMGKSKPEGGSLPSSGGELQLPKINLQTAEQFKKPIEFGSKTLNEQLADPRFRDIAKLTKIVEETNKKEGALGLQNLYQKLDKETIDAAKYILGDNVSFYKEKLNESFSDAQFNMQQLNTKKQNIQAYKEQENTAKKLISDYQQTGDPTQIKQALVQVGMNPEYVENNWEEAARIYMQEELPARFNQEVDGYNQALKALDISQQSVDRFEKDLLTSINDKLLKSAEGAKALFIGNPDFYISKIVTPERLAQARNTDEKQQQEAKLQSSFDNFVNNFSGAFSSFSKFVDGLNTQISSTVLGDIEGGQGEIDAMRNALKEAKIYWDNVMDLEMPNTDEERMKADYFGSMNPGDWNWYKIMGDIGMTTGSMSAIIGAGVVGGPAAAMTTGGAMVYGDVYSSALEAGMDSRNATLFALGVSTVAGGLEAAGSIPILKTLTGEAGKKIVKGFIRDGALLKAAPKEILYKSGKLALNAAGNTIKEIGTEVAQTALESGSKMIINEAEAGVNFKDAPQTISELGEELLSTAKSTAVGMTPISLVGGVSSYRTATREIERATMTNTIKMLRNDSEYMNRAATNLDGLVERGKMTAQDAEKEKALLERVNQIQQAYPEVTDFNDIGEITRLEIRKDGLKAQDSKREESGFKPLNESAIKEIDDAQDEILKKYKDKLAESAKTEVAPEVATETQPNTVTDEKLRNEEAERREKGRQESLLEPENVGGEQAPSVSSEGVDVKWNNTGTEFKNNKFSKEGKTFSIKAGWNRFNKDLSITVLDENGNEVSVASFKQDADGKFYSEGTGTSDGSFTNKDLRGKGLMKSVYDFVDKNYGEVKPSKNLTNDGLRFWESNRKQPAKETPQSPTQESGVSENPALKDVESTAKALDAKVAEGLRFNANFNLPLEQTETPKLVAEAYHKAKADGSNPELVKAVEELLTPNKDEKANTEKASAEGGMLEESRNDRTQNEGRQESAELRASKEEVEELLTPKTEQDAKEQQSGQMREQSVQETAKRSSDSDLPKVNETKLSDGKKTSKEQKLNESKENFKKALKKWTDINKEIGISPDVRKKAQADIDLFNSAIQLVKDYAEYGVEKLSEIIKEATKDIFDGKITQRQKDIISDAFEFVKSGKRPDRYVPENAYLRAMQDAYKQGVEATEAEFKQKMGDLKSDFKEFMQFVAEQNKEETKSKLDSKSAKFKAFRDGQKAFAKVFNDTLKSAQEKNFITPFEYRMLARRASLAQTEGQWNKLMDLTNRVLSDASYRSKLAEAERLQKQAKQKKHGQATEEVKRFTRISPEDIDINKLDEYIAALGDLTLPIPKYGKMQAIVFEIEDNFRRSNPDLFTGRTDSSISGSEKVNKAFEKASEAFDNVMESLNKDAITVDDYRYAVKQAGIALRNLDLVIADMRTMYEDDKLTPEAFEEAENMYLDVLDSIGTSVADLSAKFPSQIDQLVTELVNQINDNLPKIDKSTLTNSEKDMLKKLELYNSADLKKLSPIELDFYNQLIENFLNEGYFDMQRFKAVQSALFAATNKDKTVKFVNDIKQVFDDRFDNMPPANRLAAQVSASWQGALTGFGKLFAGAFDVGFISPIMTSLKKADEETRKIVRELRDLQRKHGIQESAIFGKESYRERAHRIGMVAAYLREYGLVLSGEPRKVDKKEGGQMEGERDVFRRLSDEKGTVVATGEKSEKSKDPKGEYDYGSKTEDKKLDQKIYKSFPKSKTVVDNGVEYKEVDPKEVYDSIFTEPNNKFLNAKERAFLIDYYKLLEKTRDLQQAANAMRGLPFKPVTLYSPRQRYSTRKTSGLVPFPILKGGRISLRGSSGKEVVTEELSAMNNNIFDVFLQNAEETMRDYYVTSAVMDVNSLYKSVMPEIENDNGKYVKAMMDKISDSLNDHYIFPPKDIVQRGLSALNRIGTFRIFVNIARTAYEITSFSTFGVLRMGTGLKSYRNFGEAVKIRSQVTSLMNDVNSMFTGSMISKDIEFKEGRIEAEKFNTYFTRMFASAAESIFKRMLWYTRFQQEFKQKTGQKFDIDKYESSLDYRKKYREAIEEAKVQSDKSFELITGSTVRAGRRKKVRLLPIAGTRRAVDIDGVWGQALSLFTAYPFRGAIQAVDGLTDLKNEPSLKRANDAKNAILGTLGEQLAYGFATTAGGLALALTFTPDDDEEEKERIRKEIDELFTLNELGLETLASAVGMLSASANGAGRIFVKAVGTLAYSASEDKEQKEMIVKFMQKVQYGKLTDYSKIKNDLKLKQAIYIDLIESSGFLGLTELARVTVDSYNAYKDYEELMDLYENGTPEQKEKAKDAIILAYLFVKAVNIIGALGAFKGAAFNINSKSLNQLANQQMDDIIPSRALENENRSIVDTKRTKKEVLEAMQVGYLKDADEATLLDDLKKLGREKKILIEQYDYTGEEFLTAIKKQVTDMLAKNLDSGGQNIEKLTKYNSEQQLDTDKAFDVMFLFANRGDKKEKALRIALLKTMLKLPKTQEDRLKAKVEGGYDNSYYNSILKNDAQTIFEFIKFMKKQNKL